MLLDAAVTDGEREFLIATKKGKSIRFDEQQVRTMGRSAAGVKAIEVDDDDEVVGMGVTEPERDQVLAVCERGYGKRTRLEEFRAQNRGGKGIILIDASDRNGPVVGIALVGDDDELMLVTDRGQTIRTRVDEVRTTGRNAQGVKIMNVGDDERVVAIERIQTTGIDEEDTGASMLPPPPEDDNGMADDEGAPDAEGGDDPPDPGTNGSGDPS